MQADPPVSFNDFTDFNRTTDIAAIERVLRSGVLVLGKEVRDFEQSWSARCGVRHAVGVANGMDAIELGLRAVGIGEGDEVITTPMTAVATVLAIVRAGATPVLADIDPVTALLDPDSVDRCLTARTKAILLVHLYGQVRDMPMWVDFAQSNGILLLEDCAQAHEASSEGRVVGSWGEFGAYSFYPTKNLGACGDAGAIVTNRDDVASRAKMLRNYGQSNRYEHPIVGVNSRLDEIQAAVLSQRLSQLAYRTQRRRDIAQTYRSQLRSPRIHLLAEPENEASHVYHLFVIQSEDRDALQQHLLSSGIQTLIHYPVPVHRQTAFSGCRIDPAGLINSEVHAQSCLSLPCAPHLSESEVARVVRAVNSF